MKFKVRGYIQVPEPVGGGGKSHGGSTVTGRVQLSDDSPDERAPGRGETGDEQAREGNEDGAGLGGVGGGDGVEGEVTDKGVDEEAHHHPQSTDDESNTATGLLDDNQTAKGASDVDRSENELSDVAVAETGSGENGGSEVEEEVGASELLTGLKHDSENGTVEHAGASEDLPDAGVGASRLLGDLGADLIDLEVNGSGVGLDSGKLGNVAASLVLATLAEGVTGGLGKEEDTGTENEGPGEAETVGDTPRGRAGLVVGREVDNLGEPDTESDEELVGGDNDTADDGGTGLGLVHGNDDGEGTDTDAVNEAADGELVPLGGGRDLDDDTNAGEEGKERDGHATAESVGELAGSESTDETADTQETDNGTLASGAEDVGAILGLTEALHEVFHQEETGNLTTVRNKGSANGTAGETCRSQMGEGGAERCPPGEVRHT